MIKKVRVSNPFSALRPQITNRITAQELNISSLSKIKMESDITWDVLVNPTKALSTLVQFKLVEN